MNTVTTQILVLFLISCVGYGAAKLGCFPPATTKNLNKLLLYICVPCMVISAAVGGERTYSEETAFLMLGCSAAMAIFLPILGWLLNVLLHTPRANQPLCQFMAMCGNIGFMGYPVVMAFFGTDAAFLNGLATVCLNILMFGGAVVLLAHDQGEKPTLAPRDLLSPSLVASVLALALFLLHVQLPAFLNGALSSIGSITSPLAMMLIGASLVGVQPRSLLDWRLHVWTLLKQLVVPLAVWFLCKPWFPNLTVLGVMVVVLALPVAAMTIVFANQYNKDIDFAVRGIVATTLWSFVILPIIALVIG